MNLRTCWWVIDPRYRAGAAVARYSWRWLARLHCAVNTVVGGRFLDYDQAGKS
jgi:hypothetical protein